MPALQRGRGSRGVTLDNTDEDGDGRGAAEWFRTLGEIGSGLVAGVRELLGPAEEAGVIERWRPVVGSAREVLGSFSEIGRYLARGTIEEESPPDELLDELSRRTRELIEAFPNIADLYADADAFDHRLREGLDKAGDDATLFAYLDWLHGFVDAVIERVAEVALGVDEQRVSPERATAFLERVDAMLRAVLERWVFPAIIEPRRRDEKEQD